MLIACGLLAPMPSASRADDEAPSESVDGSNGRGPLLHCAGAARRGERGGRTD